MNYCAFIALRATFASALRLSLPGLNLFYLAYQEACTLLVLDSCLRHRGAEVLQAKAYWTDWDASQEYHEKAQSTGSNAGTTTARNQFYLRMDLYQDTFPHPCQKDLRELLGYLDSIRIN